MISFKVTTDGLEPYVVEAEARDVLVWERTGKGRAFGSLLETMRMDDFYSLAYIAAKRLGHTTVSPAEFDRTSNVEPYGADETADPTQAGASAD